MVTEHAALFDALYGEAESKRLYDTLAALDPTLNAAVQTIAYDYFWALDGLSMRDKSLVTLATLLALQKEPQTRAHIIGFLNTGGTQENLLGLLCYFAKLLDKQLIVNFYAKVIAVLKDSTTEILLSEDFFAQDLVQLANPKYRLTNRDLRMIDLAAKVALSHPEEITVSMQAFLAEPTCRELELRRSLIHQIVYCGFPTVMNAFMILKTLL